MPENKTRNRKRKPNSYPRLVKSQGPGHPSLPGEGQGVNPLSGQGQGVNFYEKALDEAEKLDFDIAAGVDGIDDEITLLRVKIKQLVENHPDDIKLIMAATNLLVKLVKARYSMNKDQKNGLKEAINNVIKDIAVPLGIAALKKKL